MHPSAHVHSRLRYGVLWVSFAMLSPSTALAMPSTPLQIKTLTDKANLIAVVEVVDVHSLGPIELRGYDGKSFQGERSIAVLRVEEVLEGNPASSSIEIEYESNPERLFKGGPQRASFDRGSRMMLFAHCVAQKCILADAMFSGVSVAKKTSFVPEPPEDNVYFRVLQRVAAGLFSEVLLRPAGMAPLEVFLLTDERTSYVDTIFRAALNQPATANDLELRGELLAALVRRGDTAMLPELERVVLNDCNGNPAIACGNVIFALQWIDWHLSLPVAARVLHSTSTPLRRGAASAIQNLALLSDHADRTGLAVPATRALLTALHDPDREVAFAVMQSLGSLNARRDQEPEINGSDAQWQTCLHFWETFPGTQP